MAARTPEENAWAYHETLLQVLKRLNQAAERRGDIDGLEFRELERSMARFWTLEAGEGNVSEALRLLLENGLVAEDGEPRYAWDRRRVLGDRYRITTLGKSYLLRQIRETERIA